MLSAYIIIIIFFCIIVCSYFIYSLVHGNNFQNSPVSLYPFSMNLGENTDNSQNIDKNQIFCSGMGENFILTDKREFKIYIICNKYDIKLLDMQNYNFEFIETEIDLDNFTNIIEIFEMKSLDMGEDDIIFIAKNSEKIFNIITCFYSCEKAFYDKNIETIGIRKSHFRRVFYLPIDGGIGKKKFKIKSRIRRIGKSKIMNW